MFFDASRARSQRRPVALPFCRLAIFWIFCCSFLAALSGVSARAQNATIISNATTEQQAQITALIGQLDRAVAQKDPNTLLFFGLGPEAAQEPTLRLDSRITHIAVSPRGALVRQLYRVTSLKTPGSATALAQGTHEFFLARNEAGAFTFTTQHWSVPDDVLPALVEVARKEWGRPSAGRSTPPANSLLHLVVARHGGRWTALRSSRWEGGIFDARALQNQARGQSIAAGMTLDPEWLRDQMNRQSAGAGTGHFIFQRGPNGWIGLGAAWDVDEKLPGEADRVATDARRAILTESYASPGAHQAYGIALAQVGLYSEAADALEKAEVLQPGIVSPNLLKQVTGSRTKDPAALAAAQIKNEEQIGLDLNHPSYQIRALLPDFNAQPSVLRALRLGLEYSRLGDDMRAQSLLNSAQEMIQRGALREATPSDRAWIEVLGEHLQERKQLSPIKPPVIIRSPLFVLRCWPNDLSAVQVLASLEAAQHTVYADFGIPMSATEVLLWRNQAEFRNYTTRFSEQGQSEFVAALTLTKLIGTREGPVVLGEEVNVFTDARTAVFHTVAHEYGHVAVRQLSRGRNVPTWFNEGIATSIEGGYDGYLERVRVARNARALITMDEMLEWNVDGERAFLAYSQANSIVDYIVATWGKEAVMNILRQIGSDTNAEDAFRRTLGISQQELWRRWARDGVK